MFTMNRLVRILWQCAFACVLLFGGWGFAHFRTFFDDPARTIYFVLLIARNAGETLSLNADPFSTRRELAGFQCWVPLLSRFVMSFLCWFLPFSDRRSLLTFSFAEPLRYMGLILFFTGSVIQLMAIRALGRQYSVHVTLQNGHQLIQSGLYGLIRHPMYLGLFLSILGVPLIFRSWLFLPVLLLLLFFLAYRIRLEERLLREEFGLVFEAYRQKTKLLVPYLC